MRPSPLPRRLCRRTVLKSALGGLAGFALPPLAGTAFAAANVAPVGNRLHLISGLAGNVLALETAQGLVLVDSGGPADTEALLAALAGLPGGPDVRTVINTHRHAPHTGGNAVLRRAGASIIAHKKTWQWMAHPHWVPEEERWEPAREADALPTDTVYADGVLEADGERVEYGHLLEAHTNGDLYVYFREANVIAVGDVVSPARDYEIDWFTGAWTGAMVDSMAHLLEISDEQTRFVPGYGPVLSRAEFAAEYEMMETLHEAMATMIRQGNGASDMLEAGLLEATGRVWADPQKFLYDANKGLWGHQNAIAYEIV